jgi:cell division septation protein DedD
MSVTSRSRVPVRRAGALAAGVMLAACARPLPPDTSAPLPLRTSDVVHAPAYRDPAPAAAAATEPAAVAAAVEVPAPQPAPAPLAAAEAAPPSMAARPPAESPAPRPTEAAPPAHPSQSAAGAPVLGPAFTPGRWSVQVGVFAVPANAQAVRSRVAQRLAQAGLGVEPRVERIGDREHVLVGKMPDRASAQALAARLRQLLGQDVVILRR